MQKDFVLSQAAVEQMADKFGTPLLVLSTEQVKRNYAYLLEHIPRAKIHYAVKANPNDAIVTTLRDMGSCFDVASEGEIRQLLDLGIDASRLVFANPIKPDLGIAMAREAGIRYYMADSAPEIEKMARVAPGAGIFIRLRVRNPEALIDLNKKFGAEIEEVLPLLLLAREKGLDPAGLAFHVGSQSTQAAPYLGALKACRDIFDAAAKEGIHLRLLDIGGGFPIPAPGEQPIDVASIMTKISEGLDTYFPTTEIWAEPGRFICGTTVQLITRVIGHQKRDNQDWYFLDEGIYGTFSGVIFDHWDYELIEFNKRPEVSATFAGPSCDSFDVIFRDRDTPAMKVGDIILVPNAGAYTSASATTFNGFSKAKAIIWEQI